MMAYASSFIGIDAGSVPIGRLFALCNKYGKISRQEENKSIGLVAQR